MRVLVFGAGGAIGRRIVQEALEREHDVTAVHRRLPPSQDGLRILAGDVRDPLAVLRAAPDQDAVISAVGAGHTAASPDHRVYIDAARALVEALRTIRKRPRLLVVGGAGSLQAGPDLRVLDTPQFPAQLRREALAQAEALDFYRTLSDIRWTYVSPAAQITRGTRTGHYRTGRDHLLTDNQGQSRITIEDYAAAVLDELEHPQAINSRMTVAY